MISNWYDALDYIYIDCYIYGHILNIDAGYICMACCFGLHLNGMHCAHFNTFCCQAQTLGSTVDK